MRPSRGVALLICLAALLGGGCGSRDDGSETAIDRETFLATFVDLRNAALDAPSAQIDSLGRERVLQAHGVSEEDLQHFVEVHGEDVEFMGSLWEEAQRRLVLSRRVVNDSAG